MSATDYIYPYDPSGSLASNKIISEAIDVSVPSNSTDASFVIFRASPYFANTLVVRTAISGGTTLIEGVDYILSHQFHAATDALSRSVYGGIQFLNHTYAGRVFASYQTLGGDHTLDSTSIAEELTRDYYSIRTMTWDQLKPQIAGFPPYGHDHTANNLIGLGELIDSTDRIAAAIQDSATGGTGGTGGGGGTGGSASLTAHITATQNAHSKTAVQLGNVENFGIATVNDLANSAPNKYVTAGLLRQAFNIYNTDISGITTRLNIVENTLSEFNEYRSTVNGQLLAINNTFTNYSQVFADIEDNVEAIGRTVALNNQSVLGMQLRVDGISVEVNSYAIALNTFSAELETLRNTDALRGEALGIAENRIDKLEEEDAQSGYIDRANINPGTANNLIALETDELQDTLEHLMGATHYDLKRITGAYVGQLEATLSTSKGGRAYRIGSGEKEYANAYRLEGFYPLGFSDLQVTTVDGELPLNHALKLYGLNEYGYQYIHNTGERSVRLRLKGEIEYTRCVSNFDSIGGYSDHLTFSAAISELVEGTPERIKQTSIKDTSISDTLPTTPNQVVSIHDSPDVEGALGLTLEDDPELKRVTPSWMANLRVYKGDHLPKIDIEETVTSPNAWHSGWIDASSMHGLLIKLPDDCIYFALHHKRTVDPVGEEEGESVVTVYTSEDVVFRGGGWKYIQLNTLILDQLDFGFSISYRTRNVNEERPVIFLGNHVVDVSPITSVFDTAVTLKPGQFLNIGITPMYTHDNDHDTTPTIFGVDRYINVVGGKLSAMIDVSSAVNELASALEFVVVEEEPVEEDPDEEEPVEEEPAGEND